MLFLQSCLLLLTRGSISLFHWAALLGQQSAQTLSRQALWERLTASATAFLQQVLARALCRSSSQNPSPKLPPELASFPRILIQDSTCVALSERLAAFFPGSASQHGSSTGQLKIQCTLDLLRQRFVAFGLSSFRRNDQAAADDILAHVQPGDLVLRDLGYFVLQSLARLEAAGAFFLGRLRLDTGVCHLDGTPLDLLRELRRHGRLDREVLLGSGPVRVKVRLVALPVPPEVAAQRRRLARQNRDKRCGPNAQRLALLGWTIFVTNVPRQRLAASTIAQVYRLRWRVETLFKAWKSGLHLPDVPVANRYALEAMIYGQLILVTLLAPLCGLLPEEVRPRSMIRMLRLVGENLLLLIGAAADASTWTAVALQIAVHARYDSRRRPNFADFIYSLS